jgi:peptidoglycan/xylan/chitin deacetylase (PgdA/CDA1 family)
MRLLRSRGWDTITSAELAEARATGRALARRTFVVVFDDGNRDGYDEAYPILERYGFEGVFAVVVGRVDVRRRAMTWDELGELEAAGHEIANHTMHHANVARLDAAGLEREVGRAAELLHRHLGEWPRTFVYPFGIWDQAAVEAVRASHHRIGYTTAFGPTRPTSHRFTEPRIRINRSDSPADVLTRLSAYD